MPSARRPRRSVLLQKAGAMKARPDLIDSARGDGLLMTLKSRSTKENRFHRLVEVHADEDLKKRSVRGLTASVVAEGIDFALRVGSMSILARLLLPEYFGLLTMVMVVTAVADRLKDLGLTVATIQRRTITHEEISTLFWINAAGGLALALIVAACAYPLAWFYKEPRLIPITLAMATTFIFSSLSIQHAALLNRQMKYGQLATIQNSATILSLVIAVALAWAGAGYWALIAREGLRVVFLAVGAWVYLPWIPSLPSRKAKVMQMLSFGGDLTAFNLVYFVSSSVDKILIGRLFGASSLGMYRQSSQLAVIPATQLLYPVNNVSQSVLSRLQGDPQRYRRSYLKLLTGLCAVIMPLMLFLAIFAREAVIVALGEKWLPATNILRILAMASFIEPAASTVGSVMLTCGKSRRYLVFGLVSSLAMVASFIAGIPWGPEGVAFGSLVKSYVILIPVLWWGFKDTPISIRLFMGALFRPFVASLMMGALLYNLKTSVVLGGPLVTLVLCATLMPVLYASFWLLIPGGRSAIKEVWTDLASAFGQSGKGAST
jgi:O-antigen/teichoic acid export membrane protein